MRRFNGFFAVGGRSGDVSSELGCERVFELTVAMSLSAGMMGIPILTTHFPRNLSTRNLKLPLA